MGIDWMIVIPNRKEYLTLPKRGEWSNDLWKIWGILQDLESGEKLIFLNDESSGYKEVLEHPDWKEVDLCDDPELLLYRTEDIVSGGSRALYHALRFKEMCDKGMQDKLRKSHDTQLKQGESMTG